MITSDALQALLIEDCAQLTGFERGVAKEVIENRRYGHSFASTDPKSKIEAKYRELIRACNALDYDEQILLACKLLRENADIRQQCKARTKHLLVDEYQDINASQFDLIQLLSEGQTDGLFVVGDDDQSIYSWRGGSPEFLRRFEEDFGEKAQKASLPICYRCHSHVLEGALGVVQAFNANRMQKSVPQCQKTGKKIVYHSVPSQKKEAEVIAAMVTEVIELHDVLILVPSRNFVTPIQTALRANRVNYEYGGGLDISGFRSIEILAKWLDDPDDNLALRMCIEAMIDCGSWRYTFSKGSKSGQSGGAYRGTQYDQWVMDSSNPRE